MEGVQCCFAFVRLELHLNAGAGLGRGEKVLAHPARNRLSTVPLLHTVHEDRRGTKQKQHSPSSFLNSGRGRKGRHEKGKRLQRTNVRFFCAPCSVVNSLK